MKNQVKARKQGNSIVVTIPSSLDVVPGTQYTVEKGNDGELILNPVKKEPKNLEELFEGWNGNYERADDLDEWENTEPVGDEIW